MWECADEISSRSISKSANQQIMILEIITPDKKVYSGEVTSVSVPGSSGRFQMLDNHAPIISTLLNGKVKVKDKEGVKEFDVKGGVVENLKNKVVILAESA